jgi:hypothetical protein
MSAAASGHNINYKVVSPTPQDLGELVPTMRVVQKYRKDLSLGGPAESGIIIGANTNLGSKWYLKGVDYKGITIAMPLNGRDLLGDRHMPDFKIRALFRRDEDQP